MSNEHSHQEPKTTQDPAIDAHPTDHQGPIPLPPPEDLSQYEQIQAGLADRIVAMAEKAAEATNAATHSNAEVNHAAARRISAEAESIRRRQKLYFFLTIFFASIAIIPAALGQQGLAIGLGVLGAMHSLGILIQPRFTETWFRSKPNKDLPS
ncbi:MULTISPECIES: DUF2335 domain-containing protein [unclassified Corynebacterium]|uniref:DUF2335 domain-containing protein n=1 Tax=unclassified Corynebacterium TaxID=2624378 RepID=UPI0029CA4B0A|nr:MULTISPECIES: DUF2335 domain-containing protein [unclassified Corynebacterium]WPF66339.1 DUF2335 domain-containing protein [Corynebacterium sp. 22KM0430]WPF68829.1 DUF2335 domain-containing protein [Corynebacterium sp. 21KM1197]